MAEKISVEIALEGGKEVERQLADIGEAGQKAFEQISRSAEQAGGFKQLDPAEVTAKLKDMGVTGVDAINKIQAAVKSAARLETLVQGVQGVESALASVGRAAGPVGAAIAAAFAAAGKATISFADELNKLSDAAVKVGLSFDAFRQAQKDFAKLGVGAKAAAEGLQKMADAAEQAKLDKVTQAFNELQDAAKRGFGAQGTAQLQTLQQAALGAGKAAEAARQALEKLGQPVPTAAPQTLAQLTAKTGDAKQGLQEFLAQLRAMPDGLDRTNLAISQLGQAAGTAFVQGLRAAEGSMTPAEQKAYALGQALERLKQAWDQLGSVTLAPAITAGIDAIATELQNLNTDIQTIATEFQQIGGAIAQGWQMVTAAVQGAGQAISDFGSALGSLSWDFASGAVAAWNAIIGAIQSAIDKLRQFIGLQPSGGSAPAAPASSAFARGGLIGGVGTGTSDSNLAWLSRGEHVMPAAVVRRPGVLPFLEALRRGGGIPGYAEGGVVGGAANTLVQASNTIREIMLAYGASVDNLINQMKRDVEVLTNGMAGVQDSLLRVAGVGGSARGGLLGGRGTGTSDSNLAWVSRGEYITPARAVSQPGVLAFLEALRRTGGNLSAVLDGMGRFALGGLVPRPAMAFAGGGMVAAAHKNLGTITLVTSGGIVSGLVDERIADALGRVAVKGQVRSGGRKPSRYT